VFLSGNAVQPVVILIPFFLLRREVKSFVRSDADFNFLQSLVVARPGGVGLLAEPAPASGGV
jgi:hypothetical protein